VKSFSYTLDGRECAVHIPEHADELRRFWDFIRRATAAGIRLGFDTETTGLDIYSPDHRIRTAQFGSWEMGEAWVLPVELLDARYAWDVEQVLLEYPHGFVAHNAPYDAQVANRHLGVPIERLMPKTRDTRISAHLLDPRAKGEGGLGLRLKELSAIYVDASAPDTDEGLTAVFRSLGLTKATGFARIDLWHPTFLLYAGLDTLLVSALDAEIQPRVEGIGCAHLSEFEHHLSMLLTIMMRKGMRLDVDYTTRLRERLRDEASEWRAVARELGLYSATAEKAMAAGKPVDALDSGVSSPRQVAKRLRELGVVLREKTDSGAPKVDRAVLSVIAGLDRQWERIPTDAPPDAARLAEAVMRAKRADKWGVAYAEALLDLRDADDRVHPVLGGLQARTARMSVSHPPLQQLPSSDWTIRRAFIPDPGMVIGGIDYQAVEMRVLAALADVKKMKEAIRNGDDLHSFTAALVLGIPLDEFTRRLELGDQQCADARKTYKGVGFGEVFGGGATALARQTGTTAEAAQRAKAAYRAVYPEIKRFGRGLQRSAEFGAREVVTPAGRHLPLDRDRLYASVNYMVQSTARDLLAQAIVQIHEAGMLDYVLLPVHDELIIQAPEAEASDVAREIGRLMNSTFRGVPIESDPDVYGGSWGAGYGCKVKAGTCTTAGPHPHKFGVPHGGASQDV
jgi:DNA polymerase-1